MTSYRVSPELILDIADHCDRATLSTLMQTNKVSQEPIGTPTIILVAAVRPTPDALSVMPHLH
jgi:hypothetical protein